MADRMQAPDARLPSPEVLKVLLIDDDGRRRDALAQRLEGPDWVVHGVAGLHEVRRALQAMPYSAVLAAVSPSSGEGRTMLEDVLNAPGTPAVILLGEAGDMVERLIGFGLGADDVVAQPASARELQARMKAVLRRRRPRAPVPETPRDICYEFGGYRLNTVIKELRTPSGERMILPRSEYLLLFALLERPGKIVSRDRLRELSSVADCVSDGRAVDLRISRLRRRLAAADGREIIVTYRQRGYLLTTPVTVSLA